MADVQLPDGWRWRAGRAGPDYWQAERLADSFVTSCGYQPDYLAEQARMLDVAAPVRPRSHMPLMPAEGWPQDLVDAGFVEHPSCAHWLTLPTAHPGLSIAGNDREHTIVQARLYLQAVHDAALARMKQPNAKPYPRAKSVQASKPQEPAQKPARKAKPAPVVEQVGMDL